MPEQQGWKKAFTDFTGYNNTQEFYVALDEWMRAQYVAGSGTGQFAREVNFIAQIKSELGDAEGMRDALRKRTLGTA